MSETAAAKKRSAYPRLTIEEYELIGYRRILPCGEAYRLVSLPSHDGAFPPPHRHRCGYHNPIGHRVSLHPLAIGSLRTFHLHRSVLRHRRAGPVHFGLGSEKTTSPALDGPAYAPWDVRPFTVNDFCYGTGFAKASSRWAVLSLTAVNYLWPVFTIFLATIWFPCQLRVKSLIIGNCPVNPTLDKRENFFRHRWGAGWVSIHADHLHATACRIRY